MTEYVYFLSDGGARIKIGRTKNIGSRFRQHCADQGKELEFIGCIEGGSDVERGMQRHLSKYRLRGEWFADCPPVREAVVRAMLGKPERIQPTNESDVASRLRQRVTFLVAEEAARLGSKMAAYASVANAVGRSSSWVRRICNGYGGASFMADVAVLVQSVAGTQTLGTKAEREAG